MRDFSLPPFHWWRTVFYLIPAITLYTALLGTLSLGSSLFDKSGYFAHWCARTWSRLILATTGVRVELVGLDKLVPGRTYVFVSNHQSIYDIPILFWSLPYQLRIIAKQSLGRFPFLGWHLRRTGHMLVDRRRPARAVFLWASRLTSKQMEESSRRLKSPRSSRPELAAVSPHDVLYIGPAFVKQQAALFPGHPAYPPFGRFLMWNST